MEITLFPFFTGTERNSMKQSKMETPMRNFLIDLLGVSALFTLLIAGFYIIHGIGG